MVRAVLFDIGNVIWDDRRSDELFLSLILESCRKRGIDPSPEEVEQGIAAAIERYSPSVYRSLIWSLVGERRELYDAILQEVRSRFAEMKWSDYQAITEPFPEAHQVLAELRGSGWRLGLVSNNITWARDRLAETGLLAYFQSVGISQLVGFYKPDTRLFLHVLDELRASPSQAVMVGDRLDMDIYPAHLAGLRAVRVLRGHHQRQRPRYPRDIPDAEIRSLLELPPLLERWKGERRPEGQQSS
jgi:HAD superfamily hydrolase (TIGR01549 family)